MVLVTIFICIPFMIREVVPVLQELGKEEEDAARTLGASRLQTFSKVTLPNIRWALLYGIALSTARAIGEIGAVLIVSGAIQGRPRPRRLHLRAFEERQDRRRATSWRSPWRRSRSSCWSGSKCFKHRQEKERSRR